MAKQAVIYTFDTVTEADDHLAVAVITKKSKEIFAGMPGLRIHAVKGNAADTISYFLKTGELPNDVEAVPSENPDIFRQIGEGCFMQGDVINFKGENYYRACDVFVKEVQGWSGVAKSHCVKRVGHPGHIHEDFDGNTRVLDLGGSPEEHKEG